MDSENRTPRLTVRISRGAGDGPVYSVPWRDNQTVLDVVTEVQRTLVPSFPTPVRERVRFLCDDRQWQAALDLART